MTHQNGRSIMYVNKFIYGCIKRAECIWINLFISSITTYTCVIKGLLLPKNMFYPPDLNIISGPFLNDKKGPFSNYYTICFFYYFLYEYIFWLLILFAFWSHYYKFYIFTIKICKTKNKMYTFNKFYLSLKICKEIS